MMRTGHVGHGHSGDRRIEFEECLVSYNRSDLRAETTGAQILMDDQAAPRTPDAVQNQVAIPWHQGAKVNDVGADAFRGCLAARHHRTPADDRDLVTLPRLLRLAEWQHELVAGPWPPRPGIVEHGAMLEEDYRVVPA